MTEKCPKYLTNLSVIQVMNICPIVALSPNQTVFWIVDKTVRYSDHGLNNEHYQDEYRTIIVCLNRDK